MLFWAVDNPAPANYLLISGDRDFSNALHQLRMRRYNILLAQPQKASAPLIAAAKSVWLWTSLSAGEAALTCGESSQLSNVSTTFNTVTSQGRHYEPFQFTQPMVSNSENLSLGNPNSFNNGRLGDTKSRGKYIRNAPYQPSISRAASLPVAIQENKSNDYSYNPEHAQTKQLKIAPHEYCGGREPVVSASRSTPSFFPGNLDSSGSNGCNFVGPTQNHHMYPVRTINLPMPQPTFASDNQLVPNSHHTLGYRPLHSRPDGLGFSSATVANVPDIGKLTMSGYPNYTHNPTNFHHRPLEMSKTGSLESPNRATLNAPHKGHVTWRPRVSEFPPPSSSPMLSGTNSSNVIWGSQGCPPPSEHVQGLIGIILLALNTLKVEKIMPSEENITDCIRFGDPKHRNTDVRKALDCAIEQNMVVKQHLGAVQLYVGKNESLWKCVNTIGGSLDQYPKETWDGIQKFITSSAGRSAILASQCR